MTILLIILAGLADRLRGDAFHLGHRVIDKLIYGWIIAALFLHPFDYLTPAIAIAFALGSSPGWGGSIQAFLDPQDSIAIEDSPMWWQIDNAKKVWWQPLWMKEYK